MDITTYRAAFAAKNGIKLSEVNKLRRLNMGWGKLRLRTVPAPILGSTASVGQNIRLLMTKHYHQLCLSSEC